MPIPDRERQLAYQRRHYQNNKAKYLARSKAQKVQIRKFIQEYLDERSCERCGFEDSRALVFHHKDPSRKLDGVSRLVGLGMPTVLKEIAKCEVLCANCHAIEHSRVRGSDSEQRDFNPEGEGAAPSAPSRGLHDEGTGTC